MISEAHNSIERVNKLIRDVLHIEVETIDADLIETGVLDSLALVDLIFHIEQELGISVRLEEASVEYFRTVRGIANLLTRSDDARDPEP